MSDAAIIRTQADRIDHLEEENRQLRERLDGDSSARYPVSWALTEMKTKILTALYAAPDGERTKEQLIAAGGIEASDRRAALRVHMHYLRTALLPHGIAINTRNGRGYELPPASRAIIAKALQERAAV